MISLTRAFRRLIPLEFSLSRGHSGETQVKRPSSPFGLFLQEKHDELKRDNPNMAPTDIMKLASNLWKSHTDQQYFRVQYEQKLKVFKDSQKILPKRPATAFVQFFKEASPALTSEYPDVTERAKKCSELWSELPESDKQKYRDAFQTQFQEYQEKLTADDIREIELRKDARKKKREKAKRASAT